MVGQLVIRVPNVLGDKKVNVYFNEVKVDSLDSGQVKEFAIENAVNVRVNVDGYQKSGTMLVPNSEKTALFVKVEPANDWRCFLRTDQVAEKGPDSVEPTESQEMSHTKKVRIVSVVIFLCFVVCAIIGYVALHRVSAHDRLVAFWDGKAYNDTFGLVMYNVGFFGSILSGIAALILSKVDLG